MNSVLRKDVNAAQIPKGMFLVELKVNLSVFGMFGIPVVMLYL